MAAPDNRVRVPGYDILRIIAMCAVVSIHVLMVYRGPGMATALSSLVDASLHFAVPVFFFISGALVWGKAETPRVPTVGRVLASRARGVALPYVIWSCFYLAISAIGGDWVHVLARSPFLLLWGKAWYHLYFVPALLFFYALTPIVAPWVKRTPGFAVFVAYAIRLLAASLLYAPLHRLGDPLFYTFVVTVLTHLSDVVLGAWFAIRSQDVLPRLTRWWAVLLGAGALFIAARTALIPLALPSYAPEMLVPAGMTLYVLGLSGLAFRLRPSEGVAKKAERLGALSFGVYLMHPMLVLAWNGLVTALGMNGLWSHAWFPVLTAITLIVASVGMSSLLAGDRHTAWLIGVRTQSNVGSMATHPADEYSASLAA